MMQQRDFAWAVAEAMEAGRLIELPGFKPLRVACVEVPDQVWGGDDLNWEMIAANAPEGALRRSGFGERGASLLVLHDADLPGREVVVDAASIGAFATLKELA
ncbi:MAG: hypothetical protein WC718_13890 [Phycisphaerales bacterium]|jgi:hypothetical protein